MPLPMSEPKRPSQDTGIKVGDTIRMPHYNKDVGFCGFCGFRVWSVQAVNLGGEFQESTYALAPVDVHENELIQVPCIILETHPEIERI